MSFEEIRNFLPLSIVEQTLQPSRLSGAIMNENPSGQMTPEELRRLMMLRDEQRILMQ